MSGDAEVVAGPRSDRRNDAKAIALVMAFQPVVDVPGRRIVAHEARVRGPGREGAAWVLAQDCEGGAPALDVACQVKAIEVAARLGLTGRLGINVLPAAIDEPRTAVRTVLAAAARTGFDPAQITIELVGTGAPPAPAGLEQVIHAYRREGFGIALDNFASGYASLAALAELEPEMIKLDRRVVRACDQDHKRLAIISALVGLGAAIGTTVVAVGVERDTEAAALLSVGVRHMQGFLFSRPIFDDHCHPASIFGSSHA